METSLALDALHMSEGFELAPQPLAVFDGDGALIAQNDADGLSFGQSSLPERLEDPADAKKILAVALVDESLSRDCVLRKDRARWRINFSRLRSLGGDACVLAEFSDPPLDASEAGQDINPIAAIAHDFRAPLTAIKGFAEFLAKNTATPERQADYLAAIQTAAADLTALADRFATLGGAGDTTRQLINLNEVAQRAALLFDAVARQAGASIEVSQDPTARPVLGDPLVVLRILQNLVSNALRHNAHPTVSITVTGEAITVSDDGVGMDSASIAAAMATLSATGSGGLGLANCAALAHETDAMLEFTTAPGEGLSARLSFEM